MTHPPAIQIKPSTVACPAHGEHLRANWPSGFAMFSMTILKAAFTDGANDFAFLRAAGWRDDGPTPSVDAMNAVLARRPLCYFVPREIVQKALLEMGTLSIGLCQNCGRSNIGGPYTIDNMGREHVFEHFCVNCALDAGDRLHRAHPKGGVWT